MIGWLRRRSGGGGDGAAGTAPAAAAAASTSQTAASPSAPPRRCCDDDDAAANDAANDANAAPHHHHHRHYSRPRGGLYDRYFSWLMRRMGGAHEAKLEPLKARLFSQLVREALLPAGQEGGVAAGATPAAPKELRVLEVGMGLGPNCAPLAKALREHGADPSRVRLVGAEPNVAMHQGARAAAAAAGFPSSSSSSSSWSLDLRPLYAEQLARAFPPASFDAAVVTLVFCSVRDVQAALAALRRVVKPGGRLLLLEHVACSDARAPQQARLQRLLDPLWHWIGDGCSLRRQTRAALREAGILSIGDNEARLAAVPEAEGGGGMGGLLPMVAGVLQM